MKTLIKRYIINAPLDLIYEALTQQDHIENWSEDIAVVNPVEGGKFSLWDGSIIGKNIELTKHKIVQDWKEETWDAYTRVTIKMTEQDDSTHIELMHKDIPTEAFSNVSDGWDKFYFGPLKEYVEDELM